MEEIFENIDLLGNVIAPPKETLMDKYIEPPFSILDARQGRWQQRKNKWKRLGIKSEVGRDVTVINMANNSYNMEDGDSSSSSYTSIFDPVLCEIMYKWFCPMGGGILDPFAGGSVRGIVAGCLGYEYTGIDIRQEQIDSNIEQAEAINPMVRPSYVCGDSRQALHSIKGEYDMIFSCPPYADLEVYSNLDGDISNMSYPDFLDAYSDIIDQSCKHLRKGGYAVFVVGEVRDKKGNYYGFVPDTISAFKKAGMEFYNEAILITPIASASMRANGNMKTQKLVKTHQNILCFRKI